MIDVTSLNATTVHFTVKGRLDLEDAPKFRQLLQEAQQGGASHYAVSMDEVDFVDSSGLSALVSGLKAARSAGGELYLIAPSAPVSKLLELTLLNQVIPIVPTLGAVLALRV